MPPKQKKPDANDISALLPEQPTQRDEQIQELQEALTAAQDARREDRFFAAVIFVLLFDIVFFSVMPSFGGPLALLILELLILVPLAKRMGMEEIAQMLDRVIGRIAGKAKDGE